jgi:hypothetical protein
MRNSLFGFMEYPSIPRRLREEIENDGRGLYTKKSTRARRRIAMMMSTKYFMVNESIKINM